jgi:transcription elongation factor GreA
MASLQPRFTREGYDRLVAKLDELKARRGELVEDIREAREQGDLRENHAYHHAKDMQGMVEAQISELQKRLADPIILEAGESMDEVTLGVPVTVEMQGIGERVYTIVSAEELDDYEDAASEESPIGSALIGKKAGEEVAVEGPNGLVKLKIVKIGE